jgi:hypothetical protein
MWIEDNRLHIQTTFIDGLYTAQSILLPLKFPVNEWKTITVEMKKSIDYLTYEYSVTFDGDLLVEIVDIQDLVRK